MTHLGGEVVTNGYLPNGSLNWVVGGPTYVGGTTDTAWGVNSRPAGVVV